ncbi:primosomal protein N' [Arthrobacter sp. JSM 101049]|uniref:primosomal protein N' n=1 Tax=Arthrobacter sp. JSM 101049 TaxID=929097 RepID=UPI003568C4C7
MDRSADEPGQPTLLQGFDLRGPAPGGITAAATLPVARVLLETQVPHLDRFYDYLVPAELDADAIPGVRIRARFGGQELSGYLVERLADTEAGVKLQPLGKVISTEVVLREDVLALCQAVAARYAGTVPDVIRSAIPPRMARVEAEPTAGDPAPQEPGAAGGSSAPEPSSADGGASAPPSCLGQYDGGTGYLQSLASGGSPRAVATVVPNQAGGWPALLVEAVAACRRSGRGAVVVVPDARDLDRATAGLVAALGEADVARLSAEDGATPRYRQFLRVARGQARVVVGTRSAAYAPVHDLGLVVLWEDQDSSHAEPRAPYQHVREVLLLRAQLVGCALLLAGQSRSAEAQRLVLTGWAPELAAPRALLRSNAARVVASSDSFEQERDPVLHAARLPRIAWATAARALERGPVLVQVARTGFLPAVRCERCREPARCTECSGPLALDHAGAVPSCRWCGRQAPNWTCQICGGHRLRAAAIGADRTAEELGRAFPKVPVISATGEHPRRSVPASPALVVATPGAEPVAEGGYAAVLLLDGDRMLARDELRTGEEVLHRWLGAAALARPSRDGGVVVVAAGESDPVRALVRWDPAGFAEHELGLRRELGLPPAVRTAALTGPAAAADAFAQALELPEAARLTGPVIEEDGVHRWLLFFPYVDGAQVTAELRRVKARSSANRDPVVGVRVDQQGLL